MTTKISFQEKLLLMTMVVEVAMTMTMMIMMMMMMTKYTYRRQRGRVVKAQDLQYGGPKFKSRSDRY